MWVVGFMPPASLCRGKSPPVSIGQEAGHTGLPVIQMSFRLPVSAFSEKFKDWAKIVSAITSISSVSLTFRQDKPLASCYQSTMPIIFFSLVWISLYNHLKLDRYINSVRKHEGKYKIRGTSIIQYTFIISCADKIITHSYMYFAYLWNSIHVVKRYTGLLTSSE
jgi:hypothetical protein